MKYKREKEFEAAICAALDSEYINYKRQLRVTYGQIDIFIDYSDFFSAIIEIKKDNDVRSICEAIGQLYCYQLSYPQAILFLAVPDLVNENLLYVLNRLDIFLWCDEALNKIVRIKREFEEELARNCNPVYIREEHAIYVAAE